MGVGRVQSGDRSAWTASDPSPPGRRGFRDRPTSIQSIDYLADSEVWIDALRMFSVQGLAINAVMSNDQSLTGWPLSDTLLSGPSNGTLSFGSNGGFRYTPNAGFTGEDRFTYRVSDGLWESNVGTVTIQVRGRGYTGAGLVPALLAGTAAAPRTGSTGSVALGADRGRVAHEPDGADPARLDGVAEAISSSTPGGAVPKTDGAVLFPRVLFGHGAVGRAAFATGLVGMSFLCGPPAPGAECTRPGSA